MNRWAAALLLCALEGPAHGEPLHVVAAENVYGDIAAQIGGDSVTVTSIIANARQDPHLFELSPSAARAVSLAQIVVYNGLGYDPWMEKLLAATATPARRDIAVGALAGYVPGDNPHIWYLPDTMAHLADALAASYTALDAGHAAAYAQRLARFRASLLPLRARIAALRIRLHGVAVTATEPVFGVVLQTLGVAPRNAGFQRAVMNETEAGASEIAAFEADLRERRVALLIRNLQARDAVADRMAAIAQAAGVPVVGVTETEPALVSYQGWVGDMLTAVGGALPAKR